MIDSQTSKLLKYKTIFEKKDKQTGDCYARQSKVEGNKIHLGESDYQRTVHMVKLIRAQGGCLGTKSRRKT